MSANGDDAEEIPGREIAYRLFAAEYDDASLSYAESDEERAPNYVISPTGARLNRVFAVGTLTEVTAVNEEMVRARVVDPTGAFVVYAGQYQPDELAFLEGIEPPEFVAVTGKARTFQPDDGDQVYTSLRPESIATVDADTRDRWVVSAAEQTLERIGTYAGAAELDIGGDELTDALLEAGVESGLAAGLPLARDHYGTTPSYLAALRECAVEACEVVAGERDQVSGLDLAPDATSPEYDVSFASLADLASLDLEAVERETDPEPAEPMAATAGGSEAATDPDDAHSGSAAGTATETDSGTGDAEVDVDTADATTVEQGETADAVAEDSSGENAESETVSLEAEEPETETAAADTAAPTPGDTGESASAESDPSDADDLGDFDADEMDDGGMYEMDDDEREQLEEEFGAEFTTGSQVEEPGEAEIDVPEPDEPADDPADAPQSDDADAASAAADAGDSDDDGLGAPPESGLEADEASEASEPDAEPEAEATTDESADEAASETDDAESDSEPAEDVDLEDYVVETMEELDDGDGADRTELVAAVADDTGAAPEDVEDAIQDALMGGQCYEPDDETLKAI